jgi:CheY-like chemotaxis protein
VPGQGTTFTIYLPRNVEVSATTEDRGEMTPTGQECILLVEDEEMLLRLGQARLEHLGYDVVGYTNSVAALQAFRATPERFDLVITDQTMPHMTGEALTGEVRRLRPDIPIILCTGFSHTIDAEKAQALGIDAFCLKPIGMHELGVVIRQVLTQHTPAESQPSHRPDQRKLTAEG